MYRREPMSTFIFKFNFTGVDGVDDDVNGRVDKCLEIVGLEMRTRRMILSERRAIIVSNQSSKGQAIYNQIDFSSKSQTIDNCS